MERKDDLGSKKIHSDRKCFGKILVKRFIGTLCHKCGSVSVHAVETEGVRV